MNILFFVFHILFFCTYVSATSLNGVSFTNCDSSFTLSKDSAKCQLVVLAKENKEGEDAAAEFKKILSHIGTKTKTSLKTKLFNTSHDTNSPDRGLIEGKTAFMWAALHKNEERVDLLIKAGVDLNIKDKYGKSGHEYFQEMKKGKVSKEDTHSEQLTEEVHYKEPVNDFALIQAVNNLDFVKVKILLDRGLDPNNLQISYKSGKLQLTWKLGVLHYLAYKGSTVYFNQAQKVEDLRYSLDPKNEENNKIVEKQLKAEIEKLKEIEEKLKVLIKYLIHRGAYINLVDNYSQTPYQYVSREAIWGVLPYQEQFESSAVFRQTFKKSMNGSMVLATVLEEFAMLNNFVSDNGQIIKDSIPFSTLLDKTGVFKKMDQYMVGTAKTALQIAVQHGHEYLIKGILTELKQGLLSGQEQGNEFDNKLKLTEDEFKKSINAKSAEGKTVLHYAAIAQRQDIYDLLLSYGADKSIKDNLFKTAESYLEPDPLESAPSMAQRFMRKKLKGLQSQESPS